MVNFLILLGVLLLSIALLGFFVASALYDYRHALWFRVERERQAFNCQVCRHVFSGRSSKSVVPCVLCGSPSSRLHF